MSAAMAVGSSDAHTVKRFVTYHGTERARKAVYCVMLAVCTCILLMFETPKLKLQICTAVATALHDGYSYRTSSLYESFDTGRGAMAALMHCSAHSPHSGQARVDTVS